MIQKHKFYLYILIIAYIFRKIVDLHIHKAAARRLLYGGILLFVYFFKGILSENKFLYAKIMFLFLCGVYREQ